MRNREEGRIEFRTKSGEWIKYHTIMTDTHIAFGTKADKKFVEYGRIIREESETIQECFDELLDDILVWANVGPEFTKRIVQID
jgi:hypothetical protein